MAGAARGAGAGGVTLFLGGSAWRSTAVHRSVLISERRYVSISLYR